MSVAVTEHVAKSNRHATFYLACGAAAGTPIVFLHGWPELSSFRRCGRRPRQHDPEKACPGRKPVVETDFPPSRSPLRRAKQGPKRPCATKEFERQWL
jgi:pimeloyl-ACP methyl ester carboxylesterase